MTNVDDMTDWFYSGVICLDRSEIVPVYWPMGTWIPAVKLYGIRCLNMYRFDMKCDIKATTQMH